MTNAQVCLNGVVTDLPGTDFSPAEGRRWRIVGGWSAGAVAAMWLSAPFWTAPPFPFILIGAAGAAYMGRRWVEGALVAVIFMVMTAVIQLFRGVGPSPSSLLVVSAIALPFNLIPGCLGGCLGALLAKLMRKAT